METHGELLFEIWREASRHVEIGEWLDTIAPLLSRPLDAEAVVVRQVDVQARCVETVAAGRCCPGPAPRLTRTELSPSELHRLLAWCGRREVVRLAGEPGPDEPKGLRPERPVGEALAGPLGTGDADPGLMIVAARPDVRFLDEQLGLASRLLDPFTVALANDRRLRELRSLREAVEAENRSLLSKLGRHDISDSIIGSDTGLKSVMDEVEKVARSDAAVLILGETGSGKEVVARAIHARSRRAKGPFLRINCGAIPPELVDSELFGHERGSFTGALNLRRGWFERADGGTLFLDECGELPAAAQVRLLRVLQDGAIERVGGERPIHVDVRIVAATHRDLQAMVADGRFRHDLWYRIAVFPIQLPPLRDRISDLPALAAHFARRAAQRLGMPPYEVSPSDIGLLSSYAWPGNVRELAAVIERAAILGDGHRLDVAGAMGMPRLREPMVPVLAMTPPPEAVAGIVPLDTAIARHIEAALNRTQGRIEGPQGAARLLRINPHTLRARMRRLGLDWRAFRSQA